MRKLIASLLLLSLTGCGFADFFEAPAAAPDKCEDRWIYDPRIKRT